MTSRSPVRWAVQRAWKRVITMMRADAPAVGDESAVAALCTCVLGDSTAGGWPPRSIAELMRRVEPPSGATVFGFEVGELSTLLDEGLAALDLASMQEAGMSFARSDRSSRLHALFRLESGQSSLSRRRAALFVDAFLALAAQAYLCAGLEALAGVAWDAPRRAYAVGAVRGS
ncbi:MAG TPA: hypothetical protein VF169_05015 [Albitalea sp.]|uniref:hypothetical protein n=1 Tax=Piscinibacter sp. TaxID=1903157 RepID=UPI002ECFEC28